MAAPLDFGAVDDRILGGSKALLEVMRATRDITDWDTLALCLGIEDADYVRIQQTPNVSLHKEVIKLWFDTGNASWSELVRHLCDDLVNKKGLAQNIAQDHPSISDGKMPISQQNPSKPQESQQSSDDIWKKSPEILDAHRLLKDKAVDYLDLARYLELKLGDKEELKRNTDPPETNLESVLNKWISMETSDVTWEKLFKAVKVDLQWIIEAKAIKKFVQCDDAKKKYASKPIWEPL